MIEHDAVAKADDEVLHVYRDALRLPWLHPDRREEDANRPSSTITRKIDFTTDAVVCRPSDSALPLTLSPSVGRDEANHQRHERRLQDADLEMRDRNRLAQPRDEDRRLMPP